MKTMVKIIGQAVTAVALLAAGWYLNQLFGPKEAVREAKKAAAPAVAVAAAEEAEFNPVDEFVAHVEPVHEVEILPQVAGYVTQVLFKEGGDVEKGQILFEIDAEQYAAAANLKKAEAEQARAQISQREAALEKSRRLLKRMQSADTRGITQSELDAAEMQFAADEAELKCAKAKLASAEAAAAVAAFDLKHTKVYAPVSGKIGKAFRHVGDYVAPSKEALAKIVQTDPVRVTFPITDRAYVKWAKVAADRGETIKTSRRLRIELPDGTIYPQEGDWEFIDNEMSAETATMTIRTLFANPAAILAANAYVKVLSDEARPPKRLTIPSSAVQKTDQSKTVWVMKSEDEAEAREIVTGRSWKGKTEVLTGLKPGERVVHQGVQKVGAGVKLRIVEAFEAE